VTGVGWRGLVSPFRSISEGATLDDGEQGESWGVPLLHLGQILGVCASSWLILWDTPPADNHPRQYTTPTQAISGDGSETMARTDDGKANCGGEMLDTSQVCV